MKEDRRIVLTKRLLSDALLKLLKNKDIDKIGVSELCQAADINRATFYRHYGQPRDVLTELKANASLEIRTLINGRSGTDSPRQLLNLLCRYFADHAELMRTLLESAGDDDLTRVLNELYRDNISKTQYLRYSYEPDSEQFVLASYYYVGGIYFILRKWLSSDKPVPPEEIADIISRVISGRIASDFEK